MSNNGDMLRSIVGAVVEAEYARSQGLQDIDLDGRQIRITEAELAHRLRSGFPDLDTFLNTQGSKSDPDIVSDSYRVEIEVRYLCGKTPQGGDVPLSNWKWLIGGLPHPDYQRLIVTFFPRAREGVSMQGKGQAHVPGKWLFKECLTLTPEYDNSNFRPYFPVVEARNPTGKGRPLNRKLSFRPACYSKAAIQWDEASQRRNVRADVIGRPLDCPIWALVHEVVDQATADDLIRSQGYTPLPDQVR